VAGHIRGLDSTEDYAQAQREDIGKALKMRLRFGRVAYRHSIFIIAMV
jgi:hypothetical protein